MFKVNHKDIRMTIHRPVYQFLEESNFNHLIPSIYKIAAFLVRFLKYVWPFCGHCRRYSVAKEDSVKDVLLQRTLKGHFFDSFHTFIILMISGIARYFYNYIEEEYLRRIYGAFCEKILQLLAVNKFRKIPHHRCLKGVLETIWIEYFNVNIFFVIFDFK